MTEAMDIMQKVGIRLIQTSPFYASLTSQMRKIECTGKLAEQIPTEAVAIENGRINFYFNPKFLETLTVDEAVAVLTHECLAPKTFIPGVNKFIEDVKVGDKVLSHKGKMTKVTKIMKQEFNGDIYNVKPIGLPAFKLTGNHPLLAIKYQRHAYEDVFFKPEFVKVEDLIDNKMEKDNKGHYLLFPKLKLKKFSEMLNLKPYLLLDNGSYKNLEIKLDEELAWVLGYYTAEGSLSRGKYDAISLRWAGHVTKDIPHFERVLNWLHRYGYDGSIVDCANSKFGTSLQNRSSLLGRAFEDWCGHGAYNKHIPDFIFYNKDKALIKAFLHGFLAGDGCVFTNKRKNPSFKILNTISPTLAYQLQLTILNIGESAIVSYTKNNPGGFKIPCKINKGLFTITWRTTNYNCVVKEFDNYYGVRIAKISKELYNGYVYNLETKSHTYVIQNLISHNCNHVVLGHLTRMRDEYKENPTLANISQDMNANRNIPKLPKGACTTTSITEQFAKQGKKVTLKDDDTSENYYKELLKHADKMEMQQNADGDTEIVFKDSKGNETGRVTIKTICNNKDKQSEGNAKGDVPELAKEVIRQAIKEAAAAHKKARGTLPQGIEEAIEEWLKPPVISWKTLLKRFLAASIKSGSKRSWKRPNRRFGELQKGKLSDRMVSITIAIDTSGSVSDDDFKSFITEMKAIQACYKGTMTVMECDAQIQHTYKLAKYKKVQKSFKGRGGTSFIPVFDYIREKKVKTDLLIFFTDLCGDQDSCKKPRYPVLWVSTMPTQKVPFGHVISLVDNPDKKDK